MSVILHTPFQSGLTQISQHWNSSKDYLKDSAGSISSTTKGFFNQAKEIGNSGLEHIQLLKNKTVEIVTTIRSTLHGSVDGMLVGAVFGFVLWGPLGMPAGMSYGSVIGGVLAFSDTVSSSNHEHTPL